VDNERFQALAQKLGVRGSRVAAVADELLELFERTEANALETIMAMRIFEKGLRKQGGDELSKKADRVVELVEDGHAAVSAELEAEGG
jgi:hypothetical protein